MYKVNLSCFKCPNIQFMLNDLYCSNIHKWVNFCIHDDQKIEILNFADIVRIKSGTLGPCSKH